MRSGHPNMASTDHRIGASHWYRGAAGVVAKILRGAKPADIPVDYNVRFRLVVNLRAAKALGVRIPQSVLIQADEVVQ
jgi:ABC-type uncharacterized transport system substrate-binding protein